MIFSKLSIITAIFLSVSIFFGIGNSVFAQETDEISKARTDYYSAVNASSYVSQKLNVTDSEIEQNHLIVKVKDGIKKSSLDKINKAISAKIIESDKTGIYLVKLPKSKTLADAIEYYFKQKKIIEYVEPNYKIKKEIIPNDSSFDLKWGLDNTGQTGGTLDADIDAPEAWDTITDCSSVVIAIMDDGIDLLHEDLSGNMWINPDEIPEDGIDNDNNGYVDDIYGYDFADNDADISPDIGTDPSAIHGTHVAGIAGAIGNNAIGTTGVCWNAKLMALKIFDKFGSAQIDDIVEASQYAVTMKNKGVNIIVINMSFGHYSKSDAEFDAIKGLRDSGILVTAAAGNDGLSDSTPNYPSSHQLDNIISVAASGEKDTIASFSNYGRNHVDIAAPGVEIYSTITGDGYDTLDGTSMAAPHAAGVAALASSDDDTLTFDKIRAKILDGADQKTQLTNRVATSARLNAFGALQASSALPDITSTVSTKSPAKIGTATNVKIAVKNIGGVQSDSVSLELFGTGDPLFENNVLLLGTSSFISMKPDETKNSIISFKVPLNAYPTLYLRAIADFDDYISESQEDNNSFDLNMTTTTNLDLAISSMSTKSPVKAGTAFKPSIKIQNAGKSTITDDFVLRIYLSSDKIVDGSDIELGTQVISNTIKIKKTSLLKPSLSVPSGTIPGVYNLISVVDSDDVIPEINENNNAKTARIRIS